jgi:hypothetical protein
MAIPGLLDVNLWWAPAGKAKHRRNLAPEDPGQRPVLGPEPTVQVGGQVVVLHVSAHVELTELGRLGKEEVNLREARRQIEEKLRQGAAGLTGELSPRSLTSLLGNPEAFKASLGYVAEYVESGVRIHRDDVVLPLAAFETVWIASVALVPGVTS